MLDAVQYSDVEGFVRQRGPMNMLSVPIFYHDKMDRLSNSVCANAACAGMYCGTRYDAS